MKLNLEFEIINECKGARAIEEFFRLSKSSFFNVQGSSDNSKNYLGVKLGVQLAVGIFRSGRGLWCVKSCNNSYVLFIKNRSLAASHCSVVPEMQHSTLR